MLKCNSGQKNDHDTSDLSLQSNVGSPRTVNINVWHLIWPKDDMSFQVHIYTTPAIDIVGPHINTNRKVDTQPDTVTVGKMDVSD